MKYVVIIEKCKNGGYSAYVPDLPGCISVGETIEEIELNIKEAVDLYLEELKIDNKPVPMPQSVAISLAV